MIKDLNRPEIARRKQASSLQNIDVAKDFLVRTLFPHELRSPTDRWDLLKLENFCTMKKTSVEDHRVGKNF